MARRPNTNRTDTGRSVGRELLAALGNQTPTAWFVYEITGTPETVPHHPEQPPTQRLATLATCTPTTLGQWGNDHRLAVLGWVPRAEGIAPQLTEPAGGVAVAH